VGVSALARLLAAQGAPALARAGAAAAVVVIASCSLILTVAPWERHVPYPRTANDPSPAFSTALGGPVGDLIDQYRVATELPHFVGNSTYPNEQLLMWYPLGDRFRALEPIGMYHAWRESLQSPPTELSARDATALARRKPPEILVFDTPDFSATLRALAPYRPKLLRATVLKSGSFELHAWLISLRAWGEAAS